MVFAKNNGKGKRTLSSETLRSQRSFLCIISSTTILPRIYTFLFCLMIYVQVKNDTAVMMIPDKIQLVVHYVMVISIENFVETRAQIRHPGYGNQSQSNVREIYYTTNFNRDHPRNSRTSTDIPVSFKAPDIGSQNFWNYDYTPSSSNRRTFLGDLGYFNYGKTNIFSNLNSFFEFMNPLSDKGNVFKPMPQVVTSVSEPYRYEYPYKYGPTTERNFLPPPKPIRASIVKLETITRSPEPFEYINSSEDLPRFSNFKPIPSARPVSLYIDELGFHPIHNTKFKQDPDSNPNPEEFSATRYINNISSIIYIPSSAEVYQQSIKVMPSTLQEFLVNDENGTDKHTHSSVEKITSNEESGNITVNSNDSLNGESGKNFQHETEELDKRSYKNGIESQNRTTRIKYKESKPTTVSDVGRNTSVQTAIPYKRGNSIKIVTELTLAGLSKNNKTANIPKYPKFINMSGLISYELNKIKRNKVLIPRSDEVEEKEESLSHNLGNRSFTNVNPSDELSLDLKILKDTNWDGFTTELSPSTELTEMKTTDNEDNLETPNTNSEIDYSYESKSNNSKANYKAENEEAHDNKTIIIETRVTKSITKALPIKNRRTYKKLKGTNNGSDTLRDVINQISSKSNNFTNHTAKRTDSITEITPQSTKGKNDITSNFTSSEGSNISQNAEHHNEPVLMEGKDLNGSIENGLTHNLKRFNFTRRSRNGIYGNIPKKSYVSLEEVSEEITVSNTTTVGIKQNFDLENQSHFPENLSMSNATTVKNTPQPNIQNETENSEVKNIRKRKSKRRQKLKRRRTGKRRQNSTVTTEESNNGLIIAEAKIS